MILKHFATICLCLSVTSVRATMLVVVYTKDGYWIGADSVRSSREIGPTEVCKIHSTKFGLLMKAGTSQGITTSGEQYSTDKEIEDLLEKSKNVEEFKAQLLKQFKADTDAEMVYFLNDDGLTTDIIESAFFGGPLDRRIEISQSRMVLLFEPGHTGEVLEVTPLSYEVPDSPFGRPVYRLRADASRAWDPIVTVKPEPKWSIPPSMKMFAYQVQYDKPDEWVRAHPKEAIKEVLQLGNAEDRTGIGPPYVIVHVKKGRRQKPIWEPEHGKCPSWSDTVRQEGFFQMVRNPPE